MDEGLEKLLEQQRISDAIYAEMLAGGSSMEQAEAASRIPHIVKQFSFNEGGNVLRFQNAPVMHADKGAKIREFLKVNNFAFLMPPTADDPVAQLDIAPADLALAKAGNLTARARVFAKVHGSKSKAEEASSLATVAALIAAEPLKEPVLDHQMDDRTRRAAQANEIERGNNPWGTAWNITAQGRLVAALIKAHGEAEGLKRANAIAAAAGSYVGATRPSKAA
jgi:hypothetical protein